MFWISYCVTFILSSAVAVVALVVRLALGTVSAVLPGPLIDTSQLRRNPSQRDGSAGR